jgi:hypothetical protein
MSFNNRKAAQRLAVTALLLMAAAGAGGLAQAAPAHAGGEKHDRDSGPAAPEPERQAGAERGVTITNTGTEKLILGERDWPEGFERGPRVEHECHETLAPGERCEIPVRFVPTQVREYLGELKIATSDLEHPVLIVILAGAGIAH